MKLFTGEIFPDVKIHEDEQQHISRVLRMRAGEELSVTDGNGNLAAGTLYFEGKKAMLQVDSITENLPDFSHRLHIAIAPTKNIDRIEFFVEKATEMGISAVTLLQTENTERRVVNIEKLRKQAIGASKQSLRTHFPVINELTKLPEFLKNCNPAQTFVAHCDSTLERRHLHEIRHSGAITFLIGPEGDFSSSEIKLIAAAGIQAASLGNQRLRTETAGVFVAAWNYAKMV